jgi:hypothetical protein
MSDPQPSSLLASLRRFWRPETGIFLALWLFLMMVGQSKLLQDPGTFWHTVVGRKILASGDLIYADPFTFTWHGKPWIAHQWLGECLMALIHDRLDGLDSLLLVTVTILAALYTWLAQRLIRSGLHWSLTAVVLMLVVGASAGHFHIRPHLATIVFLGVTVGFLIDFEAGRIGALRLLWLIPIYILWTNIHGGVLGGLATMALALAGWTAYWLLGRDSAIRDVSEFFSVSAVFGACALSVLVNPYGTQMVHTWWDIMESETLTRIIIEHFPLYRRLDNPDAWLILLLGAAYSLALLSTLPCWPRVTWLLPLIWFALACNRIRHGPLFAVTAALALADLLPYSRPMLWLAGKGTDLFQPPPAGEEEGRARDWRPASLPVFVVAFFLIAQVMQLPLPVLGHGWAKLDSSYWPVELTEDLKEHQGADPEGTPIFNEYLYGGFLIYHAPGYRVFVDDRCELYRAAGDKKKDENNKQTKDLDQWLADFVAAEKVGTAEAIRKWEQQYGRFDFALVTTRNGEAAGFDDYFRTSPEWKVLKRTSTATFYQRLAAVQASP